MVNLKIDLRRCTRPTELFSSLALLEALGDRETIEFVCRRLVELLPGNNVAMLNYARSLGNLGRIGQMRHWLAKALELDPDNPFARRFLGETQIADGNYEEGFVNREARWRTTDRNRMLEELTVEWWRGESLKGKRLSLFYETSWGLGDSIQYARYLPLLCERAASEGGLVLLWCHPELEGFYRRNFSAYSGILTIMGFSEKIRFVGLDSKSEQSTNCVKSALRSLPLIFGPPGAEKFLLSRGASPSHPGLE